MLKLDLSMSSSIGSRESLALVTSFEPRHHCECRHMVWAPAPCGMTFATSAKKRSFLSLCWDPESACKPRESLHSPAPRGQTCSGLHQKNCGQKVKGGVSVLVFHSGALTWSTASGKTWFYVLKCIYSEAASFWLCSLPVASTLKFSLIQKFSSFPRKIWTWPWTLLQPLGAMLLTLELKT